MKLQNADFLQFCVIMVSVKAYIRRAIVSGSSTDLSRFLKFFSLPKRIVKKVKPSQG